MKRLLLLLFYTSLAFGNKDYLKLLETYPNTLGRHGSWKHGEIEISTDPTDIRQIEKISKDKLQRLGFSKEEAKKYSRVGIIGEDNYWIWIRDAVRFPGGIIGTYDRIIKKSGLTGPSGIVVLPLLPTKQIMLNVNFRHATRSWELELPRGRREPGETPEQAAIRELKEETGCLSDDTIYLGTLSQASGVVGGSIPVFYSKVRAIEERHQDESEAISHNIELSLDEVKKAFSDGYTITQIKGQDTKVYCRDPHLSYALLQLLFKGLI